MTLLAEQGDLAVRGVLILAPLVSSWGKDDGPEELGNREQQRGQRRLRL